MTGIPYARQSIEQDDIDAVVAALRSDWLTQGPRVVEFEAAVKARCDAPHAVAVSSGTAALHIACRALEIGPGDLVWTTPNTYVASANCAVMCGADVDFVDIDPETLNLDPIAFRHKLDEAARRGRLPQAVVLVHFAGQPCDLRPISSLARDHGVRVIEDASHALGSGYDGEPTGSCRWSDLTVFSFHPVKIATTGEGGMVLTRDPGLRESLELLRSNGTTREPARLQDTSQGAWYYEQRLLGFNYRLTDMQAALGCSQLQRLDRMVARRRALADRYDQLLGGAPVRTPRLLPRCESSWHLYVVQVPDGERRRVFDTMRADGIGVNVHYIPVHLQPFYAQRGFARGDFPVAERYYDRALTLPLFFELTEEEQDRVVASLARALG